MHQACTLSLYNSFSRCHKQVATKKRWRLACRAETSPLVNAAHALCAAANSPSSSGESCWRRASCGDRSTSPLAPISSNDLWGRRTQPGCWSLTAHLTTSKALVPSSDALVSNSFLLLLARHLFLVAEFQPYLLAPSSQHLSSH